MKNLNEVLEKADVKDNYCLFYAKIDNSIKQAESGKTKIISKEDQKALLGL